MKRVSKLAALAMLAALAASLMGCSGAQNIAVSLVGPCNPMLGFGDLSWSPDGSRFALTVNVNGFDSIFLMNRDGSDLRPISGGVAANDRQPAWSPDGRRIAFSSDRGGPPSGPGQTEIYVMNADGSGLTRLTNNQNTNLSPSWSADGRRIAFLTMPHGNAEIDVMEDDGSHVTRLTAWRLPIDSVPDGVADGQHIAFVADHPAEPGVYLLDGDGNNVSPFGVMHQHETYQPIRQPDWSADGKWVVFFMDDRSTRAIYRMAADGTQLTRLTNFAGGVDIGPKWSPDPGGTGSGRQIAFISFRDGYSEVYVMDANGGHPTRLTQNPANQKCLKWPW